MAHTAGIAVIGDEILSGKFADENAAFLIGELRELGVNLRRIVVIPDELAEIAATVRGMSDRLDWVFTSGGVGPTHDDRTMEGIALGFGVGVTQLDGLVALMREFYKSEPTPARLRLAEAPVGSELVYGTDPKWPAVRFRNIFVLPGVPPLFRRKFLSIRETFRGRPVVCSRVFVTGDEADIADPLAEVVARNPEVDIGSYPRFEESRYRIILTVESRDSAAVKAAVADLTGVLGERVVEVEEASLSPAAGD